MTASAPVSAAVRPGARPRGPLLLPPNRVWRTYPGGRMLDTLAGVPTPADGSFPEDWVASTTRATNPGREHLVEGPSTVPAGGQTHAFADLLASDPSYYLGAEHAARFGPVPQLLVKLLDPATRLHFQVHPTAAFAQRFLGAASGKTEAYHVLAVREPEPGRAPDPSHGKIYLGFQRPPSRAQLRHWIATQDLAAIEACFDPITVQPGDTWLVPGGVPHALGAGVLLVEVQEPSDLVVRFEFERAGHVLPERARFMGRSLEFCLDVFDFRPWPAARQQREARCPPRHRRPLGPASWQDDLIGPERTPCFRLRHSTLRDPVWLAEDSAWVGVVTDGAATIQTEHGPVAVPRYDKFFVPAGHGPLAITPDPSCHLLACLPPLPR